MADKEPKAAPKAMTKSAILVEIAKTTKLSRKQVSDVFESLTSLIKSQLGKKGPGVFTVPGLLKLKLVKKPATKQKTVDNPFKPGEKMIVKAKPARNTVKARPLKGLNELIK